MWGFPEMVVITQNRWFIMENPIKLNDLGVLFSETSMWPFLAVLIRNYVSHEDLKQGTDKSMLLDMTWVVAVLGQTFRMSSRDCKNHYKDSWCWLDDKIVDYGIMLGTKIHWVMDVAACSSMCNGDMHWHVWVGVTGALTLSPLLRCIMGMQVLVVVGM